MHVFFCYDALLRHFVQEKNHCTYTHTCIHAYVHKQYMKFFLHSGMPSSKKKYTISSNNVSAVAEFDLLQFSCIFPSVFVDTLFVSPSPDGLQIVHRLARFMNHAEDIFVIFCAFPPLLFFLLLSSTLCQRTTSAWKEWNILRRS